MVFRFLRNAIEELIDSIDMVNHYEGRMEFAKIDREELQRMLSKVDISTDHIGEWLETASNLYIWPIWQLEVESFAIPIPLNSPVISTRNYISHSSRHPLTLHFVL